MKRKLDENDAPSVEVAEKTEKTEPTFAQFDLDPRLLQALASQRFKAPTLIQQKAIPLALDGHDLTAKARTGSGKTAAYVLPILQAILKKKQVSQRAVFPTPPRRMRCTD
jgi:ATP-dependent RNA helicase DDX56/DBP9